MNSLLEEVVLKKGIGIKGTDIILIGCVECIKDSEIQNIKEVVDFLIKNNEIAKGFVTVERESGWGEIVKIAEGAYSVDDELDDYSFYQIYTNKKEFLEDINEMTDSEFTEITEVLKALNEEAFKIRKGLYLANIDAYY